MFSPELLRDLLVIFGLAIVVLLAFGRLRLPPVVGYLLTGVLVGPTGLGLVQDRHNVEFLAEVGIVALLFTIGVEISLAEMARITRLLLLGGGGQVALTLLAGAGAAWALGLGAGAAVAVGFIVALSSTAIVLRLLAESGEATSPQGTVALGMLVFQDLVVVPMMIVLPFLGGGAVSSTELMFGLLKAIGVVAATVLGARVLVPRLFASVVRARSPEIFLLCLIAFCLAAAWATSLVGLSLALGAFLAGLVVSESEYSTQALSAVVPFKNAFSGLFFVSVGMLLDVHWITERPFVVLGVTLSIVLGKGLIVAVVARLLGHAVRVALLAGVLLGQIGEFSFLLLYEATRAGVLGTEPAHLLMAATVLTMIATPLLVVVAPRAIERLGLAVDASETRSDDGVAAWSDHVIVIGYGVSGQNVVRALEQVGMTYVILEINPDTVRRLRAEGKPAFYGDAIYPEVLRHLAIDRARVLVSTIPNAAAVRQVVQLAHQLNPAVHLIVRTRFVAEVRTLYTLGANEVVPEEFETSIEIYSRVLRAYLVPRERIDELVRTTRAEGYGMFREAAEHARPLDGLRRLLGDVEFEAYGVYEDSEVAGKTLAETRLRQRTGAIVVAVHRDSLTTPNPGADWRLEPDDVALLLGPTAALARAAPLFLSPGPSADAREAGAGRLRPT